jgi:tRNA pseudouridine38-40 synthase
MVGCLAHVGMGRWEPADIARALAARDRAALAQNAPAEGLYFVAARY